MAENKKEMERKERDGTWVEGAKAQLKSGAYYSEEKWDTIATEFVWILLHIYHSRSVHTHRLL